MRLKEGDYVTLGDPPVRGRIKTIWYADSINPTYELETMVFGRSEFKYEDLTYFDMIKFIPILIDHCCELEARIKILEGNKDA